MGAAYSEYQSHGVELKDHCHRVKLYDFEERSIIELSVRAKLDIDICV